jgi:hypothetical protein
VRSVLSVSRIAQAKAALFLVVSTAAYAAGEAMRRAGIEDVSAWTWFFVWLFGSGGWAIVHLESLADWFAERPASWAERVALWRARLGIVKHYLASIGAGAAFYLLASSVPGWFGLAFNIPEFVVLVGVTPAAMGGTATWERIRRKYLPE